MTIANFQALGTGANVTTGALTPTNPSHLTGDWMLFGTESANVSSFTPPAWPKVLASDRIVFSTSTELGLWAKRAASAAESNPTATFGAGNHAYGNVASFRNVHQRFPVGPVAVCNQPNNASLNLPGVRTLVDDCLLVFIATYSADSAGPAMSSESHPVLTLTERWDEGTDTGNGGGIGLWTAPAASADIYDQGSVTDAISGLHVAAVLVLNPIADIPITVAVEVDGVPHASGDGVVFLYDTSQPAANYLVLDAATETTEYVDGLDGSGEAEFVVPYDDHIYVAFYTDDSGGLSGVSGPIIFSGGFPTAVIEISTGGGGGGADPQLLYTKARGLSLGGH